MSTRIYPREFVARHLAVSPGLLERYEARGLIRPVSGPDEGGIGYGPAEIRRAWSVVTLHREAGVNLAGVEAILHLRERVDTLLDQLRRIDEALRDALDPEPASATGSDLLKHPELEKGSETEYGPEGP